MELHNNIPAIHAKTRAQWRRWLEKNHKSEKGVWLIIFHKSSEVKSVYYAEAVEEALCFGWIDSVKHKRDDESAYQFFGQRKPKSMWSESNRTRVEKLIKEKKMMPAGQEMIDLAKQTGTWEALTTIDKMAIPEDLQKMFNKNKTAFKHFQTFSPSSKKIILLWILNAKKDETRKKRIEETVRLAAKNIKANH
ncbi:MAG TPA: YdeI/OmpD-associated family protein [Chryseolinea sp.]|nr:YdeI/OmpD-associated family protein [Chryseolinea sp.]